MGSRSGSNTSAVSKSRVVSGRRTDDHPANLLDLHRARMIDVDLLAPLFGPPVCEPQFRGADVRRDVLAIGRIHRRTVVLHHLHGVVREAASTQRKSALHLIVKGVLSHLERMTKSPVLGLPAP